MIFRFALIFFIQFAAAPVFAADKLNVVTTVPDLAWVVEQIGGSRVSVRALLKGSENPHYVDAVPDFIRLVAEADVVCLVGLDLEVGYMPAVLSRSGNAKVQPGGKGYCEAGKTVSALERPHGPIDRSMGDVHPAGNPHFYLSPKSVSEAAHEITAALERADPAHSAEFTAGLRSLEERLKSLRQKIAAKLQPVLDAQVSAGNKPLVIEYHREFAYFFEHYGLKSMGSIEEKPGVPPSAGRLGEVSKAAKAQGVRIALVADYNPAKTVEKFATLAGVRVVTVPTMVQPNGKYNSYEALQEHIADSIAAGAKSSKP
jgi:zinc/manganese transport system substrate-binding protein